MMRWLTLLRTPTAAFVHDLIMVPVAWFLAYWLRFNLDEVPGPYLQAAWEAVPVLLMVDGALFWLFGLYRGVWRFASLPDLERILKAVLVGTIAATLALFALTRLGGVPRSVPVLFALALFLLLAGPRVIYRWLKDRRLDLRSGMRVLIVGAGQAGEMLVRDMRRDPAQSYLPAGFVDDASHRAGREVQGVPVIGTTKQIPELVRARNLELILLAVPSATAQQMQRIVGHCEESGVPFRTVPPLESLLSGHVSVSALRPVSIEDLLGREAVELDWEAIRGGLAGRRVLITGAGGSVGSELCRQISRIGPSELVLLDRGEFNLYRIDRELRRAFPALPMRALLCDVTDSVSLEAAFRSARPEVVFHAAAYKHVPLLEGQVREAVRNNVLGTLRVAQAASAFGSERFILISTDKAVNPTNIMGATKRVAELYCQSLAAGAATRFVAVRFGNVLDSAGSVVPLFREQLAAGGPITVTDPEVERYFMTIPEAAQLILQSAVLGQGGEVLVLEMGEPIKIRYLAEQMIRLSGKRPGVDIEIEYIGLRAGEKLFEELFYPIESLELTPHPKIRMARAPCPPAELYRARVDRFLKGLDTVDDTALTQGLRDLVAGWSSLEKPERIVGT